MQTYILSVMSKKRVDIETCIKIRDELQLLYPEYQIEFNQYDYDDRKYKELDFDIIGIIFHKNLIKSEIQKLIQAIAIIFEKVDISCEVIGGYNDTENAIVQYEANREQSYKNFGLFGTKEIIPSSKPYYVDNGFVIYQSFEYDGLGVIF